MAFLRERHVHCHDLYDTNTIVISPYQIMIPFMAYERDIDAQWSCLLPTADFPPPLRGSNVNIVLTEGYVCIDIRRFRSTESACFTYG